MRRGERFLAPHFDAVDAAPALRDMILAELGRPGRHWHGLLHHALMLRAIARARPGAAERRLLTLAVLFHDIVYDPHRPDNEEVSASVMREWVAPDEADRVAELILATKRHDLRADPVTRRFLEADLGVLWTRSPRLYAFYADGIRAEYAHVPDADYRAGRAAVMTGLRDRIAPELDARRAAALSRNIDWELAALGTARFDQVRAST